MTGNFKEDLTANLLNNGARGRLERGKKLLTNLCMKTVINLLIFFFSSPEVGENITETAGHVKESVVESINGMVTSATEVISDGITRIPLKDASTKIEETIERENHKMEENLENIKNEMLTKAQSVGDEADKIADELIKDTEDVIRDAETGIVDVKKSASETIEGMKKSGMETMENVKKSATESVETVKENVMNVTKGNDVLSVDSLGTSAPEPEIEKILNDEPEKPLSPEATVGELENLNLNNVMPDEIQQNIDIPEAPALALKPLSLPPIESEILKEPEFKEETPPAPEIEATKTEEIVEIMQVKKNEDDLVVEDIKSTDE